MCVKNRKTYLWIEDRKGKSSYIFWNTMMSQIASDIIVQSKKNSSELVKAVKNLTDEKNTYIIAYDNSFDNFQVYQEQKILKKYVQMKPNVKVLGIICFEYILLEFDNLISWIYAPEDDFLRKRSVALGAREKLLKVIQSGNMDYKALQEIVLYDEHIKEHNIEQLAAKLLFDLTRNTGFEVSKKSIGECWIKSCCEWENREEDDICGLDNSRLSLSEKMMSIYSGTSLKKEFTDIGLEVSP